MRIQIRAILLWIDRPNEEVEVPLQVHGTYKRRAAEYVIQKDFPPGTPFTIGAHLVLPAADIPEDELLDEPCYLGILSLEIRDVVVQFATGETEVVAYFLDGYPAPAPITAQSVERLLTHLGFTHVPPDEMRVEHSVIPDWKAPHE